MTATPKLAHFVLQTTQLAAMRDYYCTLLGAHVVHENPFLCFLTFDEEHHRIAFVQLPPDAATERTPLTAGLSHSAFTFPTLGDLMEKYLALKDAGIEPRVPVQHGVTTSLYYRDPDGNIVELQIDNFATPDEATAYMEGEEYAADPVGPSYDPDALVESLRAGVPESTLTSRAWAAESTQLDVLQLLAT